MFRGGGHSRAKVFYCACSTDWFSKAGYLSLSPFYAGVCVCVLFLVAVGLRKVRWKNAAACASLSKSDIWLRRLGSKNDSKHQPEGVFCATKRRLFEAKSPKTKLDVPKTKTRNTRNTRNKTGQRFVTFCPGSATKWRSPKSHYHRRKRRFGGVLVIGQETSAFQTY